MRRILPTRRGHSAGFTIMEVITVVVIIGVIFPIFVYLLITTYQETVFARERVSMSNEANQALAYIEESVRGAGAFMTYVPEEFFDAYGPNNLGTSGAQAWSYKGKSSTNRVLITKNYATSTNPQNTGRTLVFIDTPVFDCATQMYYQPQLPYITVYFVRDQVLYRRIITDTTTELCPGNTQQQKTSCPPSIPVGSRHTSCQANDEVLATRVSEFSVQYHQIVGDGTSVAIDPTYASSDPEILAAADFALVTIKMSSHGGDNTYSDTHRITKVNTEQYD